MQIMLRVPVMTEESQIYKQNVPANFIITAEQIAIDGTDLIQVSVLVFVLSKVFVCNGNR